MRAECERAAAGYTLALPVRPLAGALGDRLGGGTGSSVEFMDFRDYTPGDDLRHVDWRSYARTDQLKVRLFREEIAPLLEVVVDMSASMSITPTKGEAVLDLVSAVRSWTRRSGGSTRLWAAGGERLDPEAFEVAGVAVLDRHQTELTPLGQLRPRSLRMVVSDFLWPEDPVPALRTLAGGAAHLYVLQVLDAWELDPTLDGARTLIDCETGERLDLVLDRSALAGYRERFGRLRSAVERTVRTLGGSYACVRADSPDVMFRRDLLPQGVVQPA